MNLRIPPSLLTLALLLACQGDDLSVGGNEPLEREDVEDLPAGDASGTEVSGAYLFTSFDQRSCACSSGNAAELCQLSLAVDGIEVVQDAGALEVRALDSNMVDTGLTLSGGIDADGELVVGGINTATDEAGEPIGDTFNRVEGNIQPQDGGQLVWTTRSRAVLDGTDSIDCTVVFDLTVSWWNPDSASACIVDSDCHPERPHCVDEVCSDGTVGSACNVSNDCDSEICVDDTCSAGEIGDVCSFPSDCLSESCVDGMCTSEDDCTATGCSDGRICFQGSCQDGVEGDPCEAPLDCAIRHQCIDNTCYDGSEGDPCTSNTQCDLMAGFTCTDANVCG